MERYLYLQPSEIKINNPFKNFMDQQLDQACFQKDAADIKAGLFMT